jgi:opacity protein-like surface antigen
MAGALISSAAYAQCIGTFNAITSVVGTVNTAFLPTGSAFLSAPNSAPDQQGGGVWTKTVGGTVDTQVNSGFNGLFTVSTPIGPIPASLNLSCHGKIGQDFIGFEAGHDIAFLNSGNSGASWHFGVLAGYVEANAKATVPGVPEDTQSANFRAPSAGLYAAFSKGNFFADVQGRLYELQAETLGQRGDARGYSFTGNAGYRFDLPGNWSLEPSVGGVFSRTSIDRLDFANATDDLSGPIMVQGVPISSGVLNGSIRINDVESALGRASVKLGTSLPLYGGQINAYPFVTASVFHDFAGNVTASLAGFGSVSSPIGTLQFQGNSTLTARSVGTYGQFGAGSAFQLVDTGWLGYLRVDYRTGDYIEGLSVNAGLRYQLNPGTAGFKDGGSMKDASVEGYDWSGPYVGASAGSTWARMHWASQAAAAEPDYAGYLAGGQAGYNFQKGHLVWGIEGEAGASNSRGAKACTTQPLFVSCVDDVDRLGAVTARLGYTWGRALFYAKGGWAFGEIRAGTNLNAGVSLPLPGGMIPASSSNWESGWTVGGGMEFALTDRWSAKAEYMHYEFPQDAFTVAQNVTSNATTAGDTVRIGVNYHFGPR